MSFSTDSASNTKAYTAAFKAQTKYGSLRNLVFAIQTLESGASQECGFSLANGTAQPLPGVVEWDELTSSRQGLCEVWCDDLLAFSDKNCATNYPGNPAKLPYDKSKCTGASMLTSIWLALHVPTWQVYLNCAPLSGATAASSGSSTSSTVTTMVITTLSASSATSASSASLIPSYSSDDEYATPTPSFASTSAPEAADTSTTTAALYSDGSLDVTSTESSEASVGESSSGTSASTSTSSTASSTTSASSSSTPTLTPTSTPTSSTTSKCKAKTTRRRRN